VVRTLQTATVVVELEAFTDFYGLATGPLDLLDTRDVDAASLESVRVLGFFRSRYQCAVRRDCSLPLSVRERVALGFLSRRSGGGGVRRLKAEDALDRRAIFVATGVAVTGSSLRLTSQTITVGFFPKVVVPSRRRGEVVIGFGRPM